jgi:hypothetical protein
MFGAERDTMIKRGEHSQVDGQGRGHRRAGSADEPVAAGGA